MLEDGLDEVVGVAGSVLVTRTGDGGATSAYGYSYDVDFAGPAVRGDMDLRLLIAQDAVDEGDNPTGGSEVVFDGLGDASSVEVTLSTDLSNVTFTDAIVEFT